MKKKGFTLIEVIVVISIIGVIAAILICGIIGFRENEERSRLALGGTITRMEIEDDNTSFTDSEGRTHISTTHRYWITVRCEDGETRSFTVNSKTYRSYSEGDTWKD